MASPRRPYERLASDDEEDDDQHAAGPSQAQRLPPEKVQSLKNKFLEQLSQTRSKQTDDGAVIQLVVGPDSWIVDLRPQVPLAKVVQPGMAPAVDVRVSVSADDLLAMLDRKLSPFAAWRNKKLVVSGDLRRLRAMTWLYKGGAGSLGADLEKDGVRVRVVSTSTEFGYGSYTLRVTEAATAWTVVRRWSQVKALAKQLQREYGPGTPFDLKLPSLRASLQSSIKQHATSSSVLAQRSQQLEVHLARTLRLLHTSARIGVGPPALLAFLGAERLGTLQPPPALPDSNVRATEESELEESFEPRVDVAPAVLASRAAASVASAPPHAAAPSVGEVPLAQLRLQLEAAQAREEAAALRDAMQRARRWGAASVLSACVAAACWLALSRLLASSPGWLPLVVVQALLVVPLLPLLRALSLLAHASRRRAGHVEGDVEGGSRLALLRRSLEVTSMFWLLVAHYRVARARARVLEAAGGDSDALWAATHDQAGTLLRAKLGKLGGLWTKLGQYIASRSDVMPPPIVRKLAEMLDANAPRPLHVIVATMLEELGDERAAHIAAVDPAPLSVASIAQVHAARLATGERVVLKVQHAEVAALMAQDLVQSERLARWLHWLEPSMDMRAMMQEATGLHFAELDFRREAANLQAVAANLQRARVVATVPSVVAPLTSRRLLVMRFCEGVSLKDGAALREQGVDCELLVSRCCEAWAVQLFTDGHFNCDPHAGNLLVDNRRAAELGPTPVLLDFGLCKRLSSTERLAFCGLVHALAELDADRLIGSLRDLGFVFHSTPEPFDALRGLLFAFRNTESDATVSRTKARAKVKELRARGKARRARAKEQGEEEKFPSVPGVVLFFFRTVQMLQGLCTMLQVSAVTDVTAAAAGG